MKSLFILFIFLSQFLYAQDERFFRTLLMGDNKEDVSFLKEKMKVYHFLAESSRYQIDLLQNKKPIALSYEIKDGEHHLKVFSSPYEEKEIFNGKLETQGKAGNLYRILVRSLCPSIKVLILFFYEGNAEYLDFYATARVYYLTIENNDLKTLALSKGPHFFIEREERNLGYYKRNYQVEIYDFNKDGIKEILIKHGTLSRVSVYLGKGIWKEL